MLRHRFSNEGGGGGGGALNHLYAEYGHYNRLTKARERTMLNIILKSKLFHIELRVIFYLYN